MGARGDSSSISCGSREGYAPAFVLRSWAERYRNALGTADRGRYNALINLIGLAVEAGLDLYLDACRAHPEEQYQPLAALARTVGRDANYLGLLARQGKLEARKRGGRWYSTQAALQRYAEQAEEGLRHRGRPRRGGKRAQAECLVLGRRLLVLPSAAGPAFYVRSSTWMANACSTRHVSAT
jgi:hypothetical protein